MQSFWYISPLCPLPSKYSGKEKTAFEDSAPLCFVTSSPSNGKAVLRLYVNQMLVQEVSKVLGPRLVHTGATAVSLEVVR